MKERVRQFIEREGLLNKDSLYLVAVSGGADSVCLLLLLRQLGYRIEAAHCNFMLRGDESLRDEAFVKTLCQKHAIPLHLTHFDTRTYAELHKVSIEMAARELRYSYFDQLIDDIGAEGVCVAHHRDDSVETVLMNLIRGTGIHGLTGIRPRHGRVLRPLLCLSREDIIACLDVMGQDYVTDSTNLVPDVTRNKIRLQLLPMLQAISPAAVKNIEATAHHLAEAGKVYKTAIGKALSTVVADPEKACPSDDTITCQTVSIPKLLEQPSPESVLFELMHPCGFTSAQVYDALRMLHGSPGHLVSSSTHHLLIDRDKLLIEQRCSTALPNKYGCNGSMLVEGKGTVLADKAPLSIPEPGTYVYDGRRRLRVTVTDGASISRDAEVATLDAAKVTFPLVLRPVAAGDRFVPFGMKGSRLVSDYLTDRKLTLFDKWRQLAVVAADGNIIWLVGQRTDNRYRINAKTSSTLTLQLVKAE